MSTLSAPPGRPVFTAAEAVATRDDRGSSAIFRFAGVATEDLLRWLHETLRETRGAAVLCLRDLEGTGEDFVRAVVEHAKRRRRVALAAPSAEVQDLVEKLGAADRIPLLSSEEALTGSGSIPDSVANERMALRELASRFHVNPLWRRVDQEQAWLCALCGTSVEDARIPDVGRPGPAALRAMRRHLLERCAAWRAGRQVALPSSILDAFLVEINKRKSAVDTERKRLLSEKIVSLQERVESMVELEESVHEAKRRQLNLVPIDPPPDGVAEIAVVYRPLQQVSGDFLDFYALPDDRFGVSIGDVSGHGIEAALLMGMAKMAFRIRAEGLGTPLEMMTLANRDLFAELRRTAFVTGFFAMIDRRTRRMTYIRAGHPPPLLRRAGGGTEKLDAPGLPFGADEGKRFAAGLEEREVPLEPGDILLLYTDGAIEAMRKEEQFGPERLCTALKKAPPQGTVKEILASVVAALNGFLAGSAPGDDITIICLKIR